MRKLNMGERFADTKAGKHHLTLEGQKRAARNWLHSRVNRWARPLRLVRQGGKND